jgi:murein DD-endopeptidase MepM/ murein hydrolase activator NlpD
LIVEKRYRKGLFENYGDILAAQFVNQGREFQAFRYTLSDRTEFFNAKGEAVRKTFLKAPLHFTRISSGYSLHRRHPILNVVRPHRGIDYAAPVGTPIKTVADGVVICRRYDRHAGRYVKVRHCNGYVTVYNHMSRFARDVKRGSRVEQGQVIGYVGSTGLSTGPHLDFRVKKNGHYLNPLKIKSEPAKPVPQQEMQAFQDTIKPLVAVLEGQKPYFAMFSKEENG